MARYRLYLYFIVGNVFFFSRETVKRIFLFKGDCETYFFYCLFFGEPILSIPVRKNGLKRGHGGQNGACVRKNGPKRGHDTVNGGSIRRFGVFCGHKGHFGLRIRKIAPVLRMARFCYLCN